jgi:hypothetical protein
MRSSLLNRHNLHLPVSRYFTPQRVENQEFIIFSDSQIQPERNLMVYSLIKVALNYIYLHCINYCNRLLKAFT